jgi:hypothetical protein
MIDPYFGKVVPQYTTPQEQGKDIRGQTSDICLMQPKGSRSTLSLINGKVFLAAGVLSLYQVQPNIW